VAVTAVAAGVPGVAFHVAARRDWHRGRIAVRRVKVAVLRERTLRSRRRRLEHVHREVDLEDVAVAPTTRRLERGDDRRAVRCLRRVANVVVEEHRRREVGARRRQGPDFLTRVAELQALVGNRIVASHAASQNNDYKRLESHPRTVRSRVCAAIRQVLCAAQLAPTRSHLIAATSPNNAPG